MIIRTMNREDIAEVAAIEQQCFSQPWSEQGFADGLEHDAVFLVAEENGIIGYIGMYVSVPEGEITNVAVAPEARGNGCGKALVAAMQQWACEHEVKRIVLEVRSGNATAIHVYEEVGFVKLGVRKNFYEFPREDADIMEYIDTRVKRSEIVPACRIRDLTC